MKLVVIGGTGLVGSKVVQSLAARGHEAVAAAPPSTGVNTVTGEGLAEVMAGGAAVVVDVSNSPALDDSAIEFFRTATTNLLTAEQNAGVRHHVALSVVGTGGDLAAQSGYFQGKLLQEKLISEGPHSVFDRARDAVLRVRQYARRLRDRSDTVVLPPKYFQPMAAVDVAEGVAIAAVGEPVNGIAEIGGPPDMVFCFPTSSAPR